MLSMAKTDALPVAWPLVTIVSFVSPVKPDGNTCASGTLMRPQRQRVSCHRVACAHSRHSPSGQLRKGRRASRCHMIEAHGTTTLVTDTLKVCTTRATRTCWWPPAVVRLTAWVAMTADAAL